MRAIVTGMIASYPVGGVLWDYGQYALGLERLGFEVYYLEDTGWQTYDPRKGEYGEDCSYSVEFLKTSLGKLSPTLGERWRFRNMDGKTFGLDDDALAEVVRTADLFLNVSGGTLLRDEYMACKRKVLIDSDPGWNHFRNFPKWDANPNWYGSHGYRAHDHFFTYAERIGKPDCPLPDMGLKWQPTRPPVVMDCWQPQPPNAKWTTVMTWKNFQETIAHNGVHYGTKEMEFGKVEQLPSRTRAKLEVAVGGDQAPRERWRNLGWSVVESQDISRTVEDYRRYIQGSRGEFSVAKNVYAATRCGWFSCRSVCYLAAGLPVVVQDTGFSEFIPTGEGLFAFSNIDEATRGIEMVEADYARHQVAAREVARTQFSSDVVMGDLLQRIGL
ncbi:MAG TPA: glycosyltransferase family 1 protein [Verrucomicrobiota bacterium]|nr:glycosyltransferase family 1 protein [Verrucomicrobiota bacterium]